MASIWDNIGIKAIYGVTPVTNDQKNATIESAVTTWTNMGLTQEQIAFGIATMGLESAFNPTAQNGTHYGFGQFDDGTWSRAVNTYNQNYGGSLDPSASRYDPAAQIAVMGAWIPVVQSYAASVLNDPRLSSYSQNQIAYGMWHEGFGTIGNVPNVQRFLDHVKGFNNANVGGYFDATFEKARRDLGLIAQPIDSSVLDELYGASILEQSVLDFESAEDAAAPPPPRRDPLTLDLDGDGIETIGVNAGAYFDHDANGFAEQTGWVGADDGLLVWDRNGDGRINDGGELFGDQTRLQNGNLAANGFEVLAEWDTSADGKIDSNDAVWTNIKVWQDADGDGYSSASELKNLSDFGITGINLSYTAVSTPDGQGNTQVQAGSFTKSDGTTGSLGGFEFNRDTLYTIQEEVLAVTPDIASLPDLRGYGNVYDLQQAMVRDATGSLKTLIESFVAETNAGTRNALLEQILFKWTGSDTIDPSSRGGNIDARKLAVLEKFYGRDAYDEKCNVYAAQPALA